MTYRIWKFFCSLKLTLILFSLLGLSVLIGSFIIQRPMAREGQLERAYSPETYWWFDQLGFFDLYHSSWFVIFNLLLATNIACCTINMWPRHRKLAMHFDPVHPDATLLSMPEKVQITFSQNSSSEVVQEKVGRILKKYFGRFSLHQNGAMQSFYVNKQKLAHFGVYVVHTGLLIIFAGGIWGSLDGFEGQMALMEGETSSKVVLRNQMQRVKILPFAIRLKDVRKIDYPGGAPKEYLSDLEVVDGNNQVVAARTIEVNDPLSYGGVSFYQADYKTVKDNLKAFFELKFTSRKTGKSEIIRVPQEDMELDYQVPNSTRVIRVVYYNDQEMIPVGDGKAAPHEIIRFVLSDKTSEPELVTAIAIDDFGDVDKQVRPDAFDTVEFVGRKEKFQLKELSGLQVARDPGAPIVFVGCAVMMAGIFWAFFTSHQKIWINIGSAGIVVGGRCSRSPWVFKKVFARMATELAAAFAEKENIP